MGWTRAAHRRESRGVHALAHTCSLGSFMELIKCIPTAHAPAQANLVGKLPNRSPWGVLVPAGDLLHCAFSGLFYPHCTLTPSSPSRRLERAFSVSGTSGGRCLVPLTSQASWADPATNLSASAAIPVQLLQAGPKQDGPGHLRIPSASGLPFLDKELKVTLLEGDVLVDFTSPAPLIPAFCFISPKSAGKKTKTVF